MRRSLPSFGISIVLLMAPSASAQVKSYTFPRIADNQGPLIPGARLQARIIRASLRLYRPVLRLRTAPRRP